MSKVITPAENRLSNKEPVLVYDRQCPVCDLYCNWVRIEEPGVWRVNARDHNEIMKEITARGLDIDQGMVMKMNDRFYYGADAIHQLALISSPSTAFNRLNIWTFRSPRRARWLYPVLRAGRNLLLKMLGRSKINNLGLPDNEWF
jgi:predicted DCC family thiol-disulfide oxidoreductase YuxK